MKTVCKKLFSLLLVAVLLISAVPFQASAATGDPVTVYFRIDNEASSFTSTSAVIGKPLGNLLPSAATVTEYYRGLYSDGKLFTSKWVLAAGPKTGVEVNSSTILSEDMKSDSGNIVLRAVFKYPQFNVNLNPAGGKVSVTSVAYEMHEQIGSKLPAPSRDGYVFAGWFTNVNDPSTQVFSTTPVTNHMNLVAKWDVGSMPVVFQGWDGTNWVEADRRNPTTGKSLADSGLALPDQNTFFGIPRSGYEVNQTNPWITSTGAVFTANTVVNGVTYVRPNFQPKTYTMTYNYACTELSNKNVSVKFDAPVNLEVPTRSGYVFQKWTVVLNEQDTGVEMKSGDKNIYGDFVLKAHWAPKGTVELRIYRDDADGFMTRYYSGAVLGESLDLNNCKIQNYLTGTYDFDGWYDYNGWVSYLGTKNARGVEAAASEITRLDRITTSNTGNSTVTVIYGMVRNYKANNTTGSGSNSTGNGSTHITTKPADPTNPATGDTAMIEVAVATMTLAAAALVVMIQLRKRKMI